MARYFYIQDNIHHREKVVKDTGNQILYDVIHDLVGLKICPSNDIPYAIEVDGWGELACVGELYESHDGEFLVEAISEEEYKEF